jgi:hypothetical protein
VEFRDWLISEMAHIALPFGTPIGGRTVRIIDMKFETYPEELKKNIFSWMQSFAARLPNGKWLVHKWGSPSSVVDTPPEEVPVLPDNWLHYAELGSENEARPYAIA